MNCSSLCPMVRKMSLSSLGCAVRYRMIINLASTSCSMFSPI
ncbi:Uncharacterised protein [Mycobacteroides abscessus subsp. abscessus]|nr:Uncharacterised protein [Mycobacteroides abscessus subsp. abscessus]